MNQVNQVNQVNQSSPYTSSYRSEIDGLRAFAVLSVVAFHAFPSWLKGGFIGVDVFFVISGFLITSHIFEHLDKGQFSFTDFFGRRIRRIFPALILVMACSLAFGWFALLADEFAQLGKHVASGAAFITNFILVDESGYFDNAAETKPMLHLWSLAVEEQFYIVWPLVLWLAWKRKFNLLTITILVAVVSFYLNLRFVKSHPTETFFWPVGRFWELLSGSVLAWLFLYKSDVLSRLKLRVDRFLVRIIHSKEVDADGSTTSNLMSFFGLLLLAYGVIRINESLSFPSKWALIPVLGAVFIIASGSKAWLNRFFLMNPIAVWFGLISYPLYLWHWPLLSYYRIINGVNPTSEMALIIVIIAVLLSYLTFILIEKPFRAKAVSLVSSFRYISLLVLVGCASLFVYVEEGLPKRNIQATEATSQLIFHKYLADNFAECAPSWMFEKSADYKGYKRCWQTTEGDPTVALIGDSHAEHLFIGLGESESINVAYYISGIPTIQSTNRKDVFQYINITDSIDVVIIAMRYELHISRGDIVDLYSELSETIKFFQNSGKKVVIVSDTPQFYIDPNGCVERPFQVVSDRLCELSKDELTQQKNVYDADLRQLSVDYGVRYVDLNVAYCDEGCKMIVDGMNLYRDRDHLSVYGSKLYGSFLLKELNSFILDRQP